jgi:hypothetical protein
VIVGIVLGAFVIMFTLSLFNNWLPEWFCKHMGWHLKPGETGFDGCSFTGVCPRCGVKVMQDSQGNWF